MAIVINSAWDAQQYYKEREEARKHINSASDAQYFYETYGGNVYLGNWGSPTRHAGQYGYTYDAATHSWKKYLWGLIQKASTFLSTPRL